MEIRYFDKTTHLPDLYQGVEDIPGLCLAVHLHTWHFADGMGEAKLRVEIHEGTPDPAIPMVGVGYVVSREDHVLSWTGSAPLAQAILDGLFTHETVHDIFTRAAKQALNSGKPESDNKKKRIPLKMIRQHKDRLY